jgi:aarF domain-containing kinase
MWAASRAGRPATSLVVHVALLSTSTAANATTQLPQLEGRRRLLRIGPAVVGSLVTTAIAAHALERSGRLSADYGPVAGLLAAVRFSRSLVVSAAVMLDYRYLFTRFDDYSSDEYKEARSRSHERSAKRILELCKTQGAVYVKVGQHVASMSHAVPKEYTSAFKQLEDRASYRPYNQVRRVLSAELGGDIEDHFVNFERTPVAAASLAQVHRARLAGSGEDVAVKIQYPGLEALVAGDLASIRFISRMLSWVFPYLSLDWMVREFRVNLAKELDFVQEAESSERTRAFFADDRRIAVPRIFQQQSTRRVLTMEYIDGIRVDDVDMLVKAGIDPSDVAKEVVDAFGKMVFVSGFVHCDGHSGNMLVRSRSQHRGDFELFLLDHGLYRELDDKFRKAYCRLWRGLVLRRSEEVERACADLGAPGFSNLFSIFLLNRSWSSAKLVGVDLRKKMTKDEIRVLVKELRDGGMDTSADAAAYLKDVPQDLLLVFKMNSLVRNVNKALGAHVDRFRANARHAVHGLHNNSTWYSKSVSAPSRKYFEQGLRAGNMAEGEIWNAYPGWSWLERCLFSPVAELMDLVAVELNLALLDFLRLFMTWWDGSYVQVQSAADAIG